MKQKRIDRRIQRTHQLLSDALLGLMREREYEAITVQDITEKANLGRTTFYMHYRDKEELLIACVKRLVKELRQEIEPGNRDECSYRTLVISIFQYVAQRHELYRVLLGKEGSPGLAILMREYLTEAILRNILVPLSTESRVDLEVLAAHIAGSLQGLMMWWLEHQLSPSAQEMGDLFWRLITPGVNDVLGISE